MLDDIVRILQTVLFQAWLNAGNWRVSAAEREIARVRLFGRGRIIAVRQEPTL